jgi:hypothetical protein
VLKCEFDRIRDSPPEFAKLDLIKSISALVTKSHARGDGFADSFILGLEKFSGPSNGGSAVYLPSLAAFNPTHKGPRVCFILQSCEFLGFFLS